MRRVAVVLSLSLALFGCDKIKSMAGGGADGGTSSGSSIVGDIFKSDFQGEVTMAVKDSKPGTTAKTMTMVIGIAKPNYRVDISDPVKGPQGAMILDITTKKGYFLVPPQKMAMMIDFNQPIGQRGIPGLPSGPSAPAGKPTAPQTPPTITKTGQKDTVAGYVCDIWNIQSADGTKAVVCLAENLTWFDVSEFAVQSPQLAAAAAFTDANHFPLRAIAYDAKGVEETRMEATKIDKKTLPATDFAPPPDYKVVNLAQMMQGAGLPGQPGQPGLPTHH